MRKVVVACVAIVLCVAFGIAAAGAKPAPSAPPPGAVDHTVTDANVAATICGPNVSKAHLGAAVRAKAFARYGITGARRSRYVIDLLVPADLGGTTSQRNLWPQLRRDAATKDAAEQLVHTLVCSGQVDLAIAQQAMTTDWTTAATSAQQVADQRKAAVGAYLAAQAEVERQRQLAEYLASLPPPTTEPPATTPTRPRLSCNQINPPGHPCVIEGQTQCAETGTPVVCAPRNSSPEDRALVWRLA